MEVNFASNKLKRCYEESNRATREWGPEVGPRYIRRIVTLYELHDFSEIFQHTSWHSHPLTGNRANQFAISLIGRWRLIVTKGDTDTAVTVEEVSNHYE